MVLASRALLSIPLQLSSGVIPHHGSYARTNRRRTTRRLGCARGTLWRSHKTSGNSAACRLIVDRIRCAGV